MRARIPDQRNRLMDLFTPGKTLAFGLYEADLHGRILSKSGRRVHLQEQPFQVLALLLERPGELVTREELQAELWPSDTFVEFDAGLNNAIKKLRSALGDTADNPRFIETVPRRGYRFVAPVRPNSAERDNQPDDQSTRRTPAGTIGELNRSAKTPPSRFVSRRFALVSCGVLLILALLALRTDGIARLFHTPSAGRMSSGVDFRSGSTQPITPRAQEEYLEARRYFRLRTAESIAKAVEHFNQAISIEPNYVQAYAGLANSYVVLPMLSSLPREGSYQKAREAAEKALRMDDDLAEAHLAQAEVRLYSDWDFSGAEKEFQRALQLDKNYAQAHQWYAEFLSLRARHDEAIAEIQQAQRLDPSSMILYHQAGQTFQSARNYDEALQQYKRALQIQPGYGPTYSAMAIAYRRQHRYAEYVDAEQQADRYWDPGGTASQERQALAKILSTSSQRAFLLATLDFHKRHPGPAYYFAWDYALLGRNDEALKWLHTSLEKHEIEVLGLKNDPELDTLRADPRFKAVMETIESKPGQISKN
jgi:DNA-binding winged helix-turn-helix (wHTH) protein/Tfp pilus assembly protein PilF